MQSPENRRVHERVAQKGYITVTIESSPEAPSLEGRVYRCTTRDLSAGGLNMVVHTAVPVGTTVSIHVVFTDPPADFTHFGRVAWRKVVSEGFVQSYSIGIEFRRTDGNSALDWGDMLKGRMQGSRNAGSSAGEA